MTAYHQRIAPPLRQSGRSHLHEVRKDVRIFADARGFANAMNDARIAICFPGSLTHPEHAGNVETLTQRYLAAMAAGCLVVGQSPAELRDLFGYDPAITACPDDPAAQIAAILGNLAAYEPLRQRNLARVRAAGSWSARIDQLLGELVKPRAQVAA